MTATIPTAVHTAGVQVWSLQRVLAKKRDPVSHTRFLDAVLDAAAAAKTDTGSGGAKRRRTVFEDFLGELTACMRRRLQRHLENSERAGRAGAAAYPAARHAEHSACTASGAIFM